MVLGRPFRSQIIAPLGPQWVLYSDAKLHSAVLINHPSDAATAGDSMVSALFGLVNVANAQIPGASTQPVVNAVQTTVKQVDVTSAVTKFASPSFAVKDGVLYLGLTPESVVNSAISPAVPPAADLMHSADFTAAVKRLGAPQIGSFDYCDLPNTAPAAYDSFGKAGAQIRQVMSMFSIDVPKIELPPIDQLKTHLSPAISVSWADDQGVYAKSISPFPLSTQLLGDPQQSVVSATTISMASAILMPAFSRARSAARATQLMSNERQMLLGLMMYANNHRGLLPPDLGSLITDGDIAPTGLKLFLLPDSKKQIPAEISGGTKEQIAAWVNDNSDFKFLLAGKKMSELGNASRVAAIVPNDAETATANVPVGFADGHVEACRPDRVQQILHPDRGDN
jgi:prepilin-type processing-associated H-X9-DG protein